MKKSSLLFAFLFSAVYLFAQEPVSADSLAKYEGQLVTVCAKVTGTHITNGKSKTTFINFGKPFPNHTFSVVIFEKDLQNFTYKPAKKLLDKKICVSGKIKIYNGKPEMIISLEDQIRIE